MTERNLKYGIERNGRRKEVDFRVCMRFMQDGEEKTIYGRGSDLSEGGMAVYAAGELQEGMRVDVEFTLPDARRPLWVEGIVRNRQGYRYGLEFVTLSSSLREQIRKLCGRPSILDAAGISATSFPHKTN